jgi:hypothetical protein
MLKGVHFFFRPRQCNKSIAATTLPVLDTDHKVPCPNLVCVACTTAVANYLVAVADSLAASCTAKPN